MAFIITFCHENKNTVWLKNVLSVRFRTVGLQIPYTFTLSDDILNGELRALNFNLNNELSS